MSSFVCEWCDSTNPKYIHDNRYNDGKIRIEVVCSDCCADEEEVEVEDIQARILSSDLIKIYYEALNYKDPSVKQE